MTAQQLRRLEPSRRHLLMLVLPQALVIERGDELLGLFDKLLRLSDGRARRRVDDQRRKTARQRVHPLAPDRDDPGADVGALALDRIRRLAEARDRLDRNRGVVRSQLAARLSHLSGCAPAVELALAAGLSVEQVAAELLAHRRG